MMCVDLAAPFARTPNLCTTVVSAAKEFSWFVHASASRYGREGGVQVHYSIGWLNEAHLFP